jgi:hypothetical protein
MKQTAIEWLIDNLKGGLNLEEATKIINQAKEMEKNQHALTAGLMIAHAVKKMSGQTDLTTKEAFDQYYKEAFGK